jgi:hypothetical protein
MFDSWPLFYQVSLRDLPPKIVTNMFPEAYPHHSADAPASRHRWRLQRDKDVKEHLKRLVPDRAHLRRPTQQ